MWKVWAPRLVGIVVLIALLIAAFVALTAEARKNRLAKSASSERSAGVHALYDEARLDRSRRHRGPRGAARAALYAELEQLVANERA